MRLRLNCIFNTSITISNNGQLVAKTVNTKPFVIDGNIHKTTTIRLDASYITSDISAESAAVGIVSLNGVNAIRYKVQNDSLVEVFNSEYTATDGDVLLIYLSSYANPNLSQCALVSRFAEAISGIDSGASVMIPCKAGLYFFFVFARQPVMEAWNFETISGTTVQKSVSVGPTTLTYVNYNDGQVLTGDGVIQIREFQLVQSSS